MIIIMEPESSDTQIENVVNHVQELGMKTIVNKGVVQTVIAAIGETSKYSTDLFERLDGVRKIERIQVPYKLASRDSHHTDSVITIGDNVKIGGSHPPIIMAGPCSVDTKENMMAIANTVKDCGGKMLRGGAFKPRTGPRAFEGKGKEALEYMLEAKKETGLPIVTEIMDARHLELISEYADMLQVGARNMQNFTLLDEIGKSNIPVLLKRGLSATIDEWLLAAERILDGGNMNVIFCERGIRTFDNKHTRNTADIAAIPVLKRLTHLPVVFDPSHAVGKWNLVAPITLAAIAAGADGIIVEVHPKPEEALSDGPQSLMFDKFKELTDDISKISGIVHKEKIAG